MTDDEARAQIAPPAVDENPSRRWRGFRRAIVWLVVLAPVVLVLAGQGADNWCASEGFRRSSGFGQELTISVWPPGVECTLEFDGTRTEVYWPIDW